MPNPRTDKHGEDTLGHGVVFHRSQDVGFQLHLTLIKAKIMLPRDEDVVLKQNQNIAVEANPELTRTAVQKRQRVVPKQNQDVVHEGGKIFLKNQNSIPGCKGVRDRLVIMAELQKL